jgi:hypothetical protein
MRTAARCVGGRRWRQDSVAVGNALQQLENAGILQRLNEKKWGRPGNATSLLELVGDFEKSMSTL